MRPRLLAVTLCAILVGCGGGSSSSSPASTPTGSSSGGGVAVGVITGFSSVFVDGVRYEVESDTQVDLDGTVTAGSDQALRIGMKVSLQSQEVDGVRVASQITYDKDLSGPAVNVMPNAENPAIGTFEILGQQVVVDSGTVFDDEWPDRNSDGESDLNDLVGTADPVIVEVSGFLTEDGFLATRLEVETDSDDGLYELEGVVDAVDVSGDTFTINQLTVQVDGATEFVAPLVFDDSLVGQYLEVEVEERTGEANLFAVIVAAEDESDFDDDEAPEGELEVRGVLSAVNTELSPAEIVIGGSTLQVSDTASLAGLVGKIVRIEGEFNAEGVLVIDSVEARLEVNVELEDTVAVVDLVEGTVTTRLGVVITPDGVSRVRDDDEGGHHLTPTEWLERVMPGDYLEAEGALQEGSVTWLNLEVEGVDAGEEPGDEACELRGPVANVNAEAGTFTILDVTIQSDNNTEFETDDDRTVSQSDFFAALQAGAVVEAESDDAMGCSNGVLLAEEIGFESEDDRFDGDADDEADESGDDSLPGVVDELSGVPVEISDTGFVLGDRLIAVSDETLIDDSLIEMATGEDTEGDEVALGDLAPELTLTDLLNGETRISVEVDEQDLALRIEDDQP